MLLMSWRRRLRSALQVSVHFVAAYGADGGHGRGDGRAENLPVSVYVAGARDKLVKYIVLLSSHHYLQCMLPFDFSIFPRHTWKLYGENTFLKEV